MSFFIIFLVPVFEVEWSVPVGFDFFALPAGFLFGLHYGEPFVKVFLEFEWVFFVVFHNHLTASSIP